MNRKGYNLIEVLISMALLAWVVLVISGLFIYGQKGVYSGKIQTKAVAVGQKVYEDIKNLPNYDQKYNVFRDSGNATLNGKTTWTVTIAPASTNPHTEGEVLWQVIEGWQQVLADIGSTAEIQAVLTPEIAVDTAAAASFGNSFYIHYHIQVQWAEGLRNRRVTFDFSI